MKFRLVVIMLLINVPAFAGEIHDAAHQRQLSRVKELLQATPMLLEAADNADRTPLHSAASREYTTPENLGSAINTPLAEFSPFVAPDETYLIVTRSESDDDLELFLSFREPGGTWSEARNMGAPVNTD